jgi:lipopolysaccharide transport system ATP-binding protein
MYYGAKDVIKSMLGMKIRTDMLRPDEFWAADGITFELRRGESLGVMGENGSGKSTLLRLLSGIYRPDKGRIELRGRVGALIAIGAGFHPLMTGRENIYLNGAILGMTRKEIESRLDSIVQFADIEDFLEAPVKTYSSGMYVRLGFAIAISAEPDILLVDEVLAVGDVNFQKKCYERLIELRRKGTSIVFVSHQPSAIQRLCTKCLVMMHGGTAFYGNTREGVQKYFTELSHSNLRKNLRAETVGVGDVVFSDVRVYQEGGDKDDPNIEFGKNFVIEFRYKFLKKKTDTNQMRVTIRTFEGRDVQKMYFHELPFFDDHAYPNEKVLPIDDQGTGRITVLNPRLFPQTFIVDIASLPVDMAVHLGGIANAATFNVIPPLSEKMYFEYGNLTVTEFEYRVQLSS